MEYSVDYFRAEPHDFLTVSIRLDVKESGTNETSLQQRRRNQWDFCLPEWVRPTLSCALRKGVTDNNIDRMDNTYPSPIYPNI